jgi:cytosine/adenosine deaminase-related metal-dependent hydrolase
MGLGGGILGAVMKAYQRIANASCDPDQLKALREAFDDAWERVAPHVSQRADAVEAARLTLADIVLGLAKAGNFDPQQLADAAVKLILGGPRNREDQTASARHH